MEQQNQQPIQEKAESKPPIKTNWKLFGVVTIVAIILAVGGILLFAYFNKSTGTNPITYAQCSQLEQEISALIQQANYCIADEDCTNVEVPYGCGCLNLANKNSDLSNVKVKVAEWEDSCKDLNFLCSACAMSPYGFSCKENKCVEIWYLPVQLQELKQNPFGAQQKIVVKGIYRWGFEDSNFDETADSREYNIWVAVNEDTKLENTPLNFNTAAFFGPGTPDARHEGTANVIIYGTFQAYNANAPSSEPLTRGNFGHLGLWKHQIVADKIVFHANTVIVNTDKDTYSREEDIMVTVQNTLDSDIWIGGQCGFFDLLKKNGDEWKRYSPYPTKDCIAAYQQINPLKEREIVANLRDVYEYKYFVVVPGVYKLELKYALSNPLLVGGKIKFFDAFSNEFEVKD